MPTLLRWQGYRFYFFSNEGYEPAHVHVDKDSKSAKFWLQPLNIARNYGFTDQEIRLLLSKLVVEQPHFLEAWNGYFNK